MSVGHPGEGVPFHVAYVTRVIVFHRNIKERDHESPDVTHVFWFVLVGAHAGGKSYYHTGPQIGPIHTSF